LNALSSDRLVRFIEDKLEAHGVVPSADELGRAYRLFANGRRIEAVVREVMQNIGTSDVAIPADLDFQVREYLRLHPTCRWDEAVAYIFRGGDR
jgi:hypothetical protein